MPYFVPHYGTLWHKYTLLKCAMFCAMFCAILWHIVAQVYIRNSVPYFVPCYGTLWHKYTLEKVGTSTEVGAVEQECSTILDLLTFPFARYACKA